MAAGFPPRAPPFIAERWLRAPEFQCGKLTRERKFEANSLLDQELPAVAGMVEAREIHAIYFRRLNSIGCQEPQFDKK